MKISDQTANFLSLFASSSTLICCALPALFVLLGAGSSFASLLNIFPFLIVVSQHKLYITFFALVMLVLAGYMNYKTYHMPCPIDPVVSETCMQTRRRARYVYYISALLFLVATTFTYLVPRFI